MPTSEPVTLLIKGEEPTDEGTDLTLCRVCGTSLTMMVGDWLLDVGSEVDEHAAMAVAEWRKKREAGYHNKT